MKVSLIRAIEFFNVNEPIHPRDRIPSFELLNIASFLEKNKIKYKHFDNEVMHLDALSFQEAILREKSDVLIIHFQPLVAEEIINLIKKLKQKNKNCTVIIFSPIVDQQTELFLRKSQADVAILGETEVSAFELIELILKYKNRYLSQLVKLGTSGLSFLYHKKFIRHKLRRPANLDELPFMAHHLLYESKSTHRDDYKVTSKSVFVREKIKWGFLLSSRGCPYGCTFCSPSIRNSTGRQYRFQSPKRTADEIEYLVKNFAVNAISFEDDLFTINRSRVIELCKEIISRKIKISWTVATRLDALDLELLTWMKKAGCFGMSAGVESGSDRILSLIKKGEQLKDIKRGVLLLHKVGIALTTNLIIGHPTETIEELHKTLALAKELKPVFIHLHYLTPYPGTQIFAKYQSGLSDFKDFSHWKAHEFNISAIDTKILQKMMRYMYLTYYLRFSYALIYFKFRHQYYLYNFNFELNFLFNTLKYLLLKA